MAANALGHDPRERALGLVTAASGGARSASVLARSVEVGQALLDGFGAPNVVPEGQGAHAGLDRARIDAFLQALPQFVQQNHNPIGNLEDTTERYMFHFLNAIVLQEVGNLWINTEVRFNLNQPVDPNQNQPEIRITGHPGIVLMRGNAPYCVIELKHFQENDALFARGIRQAHLYAAAIGMQTGREVRAIVSDVSRWCFLRVNAQGYAQSAMYVINCDGQDGEPNGDQLTDVLQLVCNFLELP